MAKKEAKLNDFKPEELEAIKSDNKKLNERVDALAALLGDLEGQVKGLTEKSYPGDIANAIREGFGGLAQRPVAAPAYVPPPTYQAPSATVAPISAPPPGGFQFNLFSIGWKIKGSAPAPANPKWGWAFGYTQDGGYHPDTATLVQYLEQYGSYSAGGYTVKLGGRDNKLLQLNKN